MHIPQIDLYKPSMLVGDDEVYIVRVFEYLVGEFGIKKQ